MLDSKSTFEVYTPLLLSGLRKETFDARQEAESKLSWLDYPHRPFREDDDIYIRIESMNTFSAADDALLQYALNDMMALG
jgi:hypothetical protein